MNIHIIPRLCPTALGMSVAQHVKNAGHELSDVGLASFIVGVVESEWSDVPGKQKIIVVDPGKVETVPEDAILFSAFTLTMIDNPTVDLTDFLKNTIDPLSTDPAEISDKTKIAKLETGLFYLNEHIKVLENWALRGDLSISAMQSLIGVREQFDRVAQVLPPKRPD